MNHTELTGFLQDWVESSEATMVADLDEMIRYGELRIYKSIDFAVTRLEDDPVSLVQGTAIVALPADTITVRYVTLLSGTTRTILDQKDPSFIDLYVGDRTTEGALRYYAMLDEDNLLVAPAPANSDDTLIIARTIRPAPMTASNSTTWLGDTHPELLLYSCLLEIATFQKSEQDTVADYQNKYKAAMEATLVEENHRNRYDRARYGEIGVGG
jgi:hypothetical protein